MPRLHLIESEPKMLTPRNIACVLVAILCGIAAVWALDHFTMPPKGASGAFVGAVVGYLFSGAAFVGWFAANRLLPHSINR